MRPVFLLTLLACCRGAPTSVKVVGRQLLVDGKPLHLKGVCWNPVPKGGVHPKDLDFRGFVESDSDLMARAGINAVRTYDAITDLDVLDILWKKHIYVLNTVYIWGKAPIDSVVANVNAVKNHPAILMWVVGNEWNYNGLYVGLPFPVALKRVKQAVEMIKQSDAAHPVATVHGEVPNGNTLAALPDVDVWGINKYSGISFGNLFEAWGSMSSAPMFLGEYGADAYNTQASRRDEHAQAVATKALTEQIVQASSVNPGGVCIGGIIFEFADEWWKDGSGNPNKHDVGGVSPGGGPYPDMTFNEEWWGLVRYDGTPREAFRAYADIPIPGCDPAPQLAAAVRTVPSTPHRLSACGAHPACHGKLGNCCPSSRGQFLGCCTSTATTTQAASLKLPSTTWLAPLPHHQYGGQATGSHLVLHEYTEYRGKFANGHFKVGTAECSGVGECQFETRREAQEFCNSQPKCTAVLLHPFEDGCAGGYGCYTPRYGSISTNSLWDRSGGKAWVKGAALGHQTSLGKRHPHALPHRQYIFVGFATANEAEAACKPYGRVAAPKSPGEQHWLQYAVDAAQAAGKLSKKWPQNTIWLGGYWNGQSKQWEWNDGTPIAEFNWADGQPSAAKHQATEPWLCMVLNGQMHDSDPPYRFGIFCEQADESHEHVVRHEIPHPPKVLSTTPAAPSTRPSAEKQQPRAAPVLRPTNKPVLPKVLANRRHGPYQFVGFHGPEEARIACGAQQRLAMPKTSEQQQQLQAAIAAALEDHEMSKTWPNNTIWMGASWNDVHGRWEWDDGTAIVEVKWAAGQPSASSNQNHEPWLCMVADGHVHDSDSPYAFGVMCEEGAPAALAPPAAAAAARHAKPPTPAPPPKPPKPPTPAPAVPDLVLPPTKPPAGLPPSTPAPVPGPGQQQAAAEHLVVAGSYTFRGYYSPAGAREACTGRGRLATPESDAERQGLHEAIDAALESGQMSKSWPNNTIWLGGHWNNASHRWEWDDGSPISGVKWAAGQPSARGHQWTEPWLCMVSDGHVHDSDPPYHFGVICQSSSPTVARRLQSSPSLDSDSDRSPMPEPHPDPEPAPERGPPPRQPDRELQQPPSTEQRLLLLQQQAGREPEREARPQLRRGVQPRPQPEPWPQPLWS